MKLIKRYHSWTIYYDKKEEVYLCFLPGQSPRTMDYPEWEGGSLKEIQDFIDSY